MLYSSVVDPDFLNMLTPLYNGPDVIELPEREALLLCLLIHTGFHQLNPTSRAWLDICVKPVHGKDLGSIPELSLWYGHPQKSSPVSIVYINPHEGEKGI